MNPMSGMPMQNNAGGIQGAQFPGSTNGQASPIPPQSPMMHQAQQNPMFTLSGNPGQNNAGNTGIDPRVMMSGGGGINMNNLTPHQRQQLMLMQQQQQQPSRFGGNNAPPNSSMMSMNPMTMNLNPQQAAAFAAQHQQRMAHAGSPTHASPGIDGGQGFPILRSNSTIPGIARSTRSPSESAPSPMTPRGPPARGSSLSQEDYQRMMMQQQQQQGSGAGCPWDVVCSESCLSATTARPVVTEPESESEPESGSGSADDADGYGNGATGDIWYVAAGECWWALWWCEWWWGRRRRRKQCTITIQFSKPKLAPRPRELPVCAITWGWWRCPSLGSHADSTHVCYAWTSADVIAKHEQPNYAFPCGTADSSRFRPV
jgi:hypothetical protein